jgi:hypothetical protein
LESELSRWDSSREEELSFGALVTVGAGSGGTSGVATVGVGTGVTGAGTIVVTVVVVLTVGFLRCTRVVRASDGGSNR